MRRLLLILLLSTPALAGQSVYRWVDANGKVHYGDRPPAPQAEKVEIRAPAPSAPVTPPAAPTAAATAAAASTECQRWREQLARYQASPVLIEVAPDGSRQEHLGESRNRVILRAEQAMREACRPPPPEPPPPAAQESAEETGG